MDNKKLLLGLIGAIAGIVAFRAYQISGIASAAAVLVLVAWTLFYLRTADNVVKALGSLLDPFHTAVNFLLLGFIYGSLSGRGFWISAGVGVAASVLGVIVSMWIYKYWTIGE